MNDGWMNIVQLGIISSIIALILLIFGFLSLAIYRISNSGKSTPRPNTKYTSSNFSYKREPIKVVVYKVERRDMPHSARAVRIRKKLKQKRCKHPR